MANKNKFDCIIVGGGATGAGIARDLSLRGLSVLLLEKNDLSEGTTGRCHAMLHSGGRYVYKDKIAATECAIESEILLKIAPHITEMCGGFFIAVDEEDVEYGDIFEKSCREAEVFCEELNPQEFLAQEPKCNSEVKRVFRVNDGYIDPFLLTYYNAYDAKLNGAKIKTYSKVENLLLKGSDIVGVEYYDKLKNATKEAYSDMLINATGPWAQYLEKDLELERPLQISPTMGSLLVIQNRLVDHLINRLRKPGDGDIFVPSHQSVILGTTSIPKNYEELDHLLADREEIEYLLDLGEYLIPSIREYNLLRFYSGARPLVASGGSPREASRKFEVIDYEEEGYSGFITIFGGKLTTYRLMAEKVSDLICEKLGIVKDCTTAGKTLPGGERKVPMKTFKEKLHVEGKTAFDMQYKWGTFYNEISELCQTCIESYNTSGKPRMICECEHVTEPEISWVKENLHVKVIDDYRRRTRQAMGPCQGQFCYYKICDLESKWTNKTHNQIIDELTAALKKRWKTESHGGDFIKKQIKLSKYLYLLGGNLNERF
ncbi:MAG: Anaerobic glycerol-3-phosphate dehydrogenase subunit A [Promethearchaeota archaeon]|nr:MAG: Anaerobic glycerol-3-phosphate dehydrogenase subunit A [Candidatus Lokiarchaeota archaeon]